MKTFVFLSVMFMVVWAQAKTMDSLRVETIKGQRFIIHKVDAKETIADLIRRYRTSGADLFRYNEIKKNKIEQGQIIRIPLPPAEQKTSTVNAIPDSTVLDEAHANAQAQEVQKVLTHVVADGETIAGIAKKYKITQAQITKWNNLKVARLTPGQTLIIDEAAAVRPNQKLNGPEAQLPQYPVQPQFAQGDMIEQTGIAIIDETMQVLHPDAPIGTIIKVINLDNNKQCLVRVTGTLDTGKFKNFVISIGKETLPKLGADAATIRVKLEYMVKP